MAKTKDRLAEQQKAQDSHEQQPADETIAAGEHMDLELMDDTLESERAAGAPAPTGVILPAPSQSMNPNLAEELQGMELVPKTFGPPQYGSPDPASAASRLMTLEDGHPLSGLESGTAAISEDYGVMQAPGEEIDATEAAEEAAEEEGVNLAAVEGTGKEGKITKGDVEKVAKGNKTNN